MNDFNHELTQRLDAIRQQGLLRELRRVDSPQSPRIEIGGRALLNFSSNDYLGLANEPALKEAAIKAVERYGAGAGASRLICGSLAPHQELDETLAAFKGTEAALSFLHRLRRRHRHDLRPARQGGCHHHWTSSSTPASWMRPACAARPCACSPTMTLAIWRRSSEVGGGESPKSEGPKAEVEIGACWW